ncbi:MAG: PilZ domain-containing protein [Planctomycetota bacterium]|jgi:hypothetical protein
MAPQFKERRAGPRVDADVAAHVIWPATQDPVPVHTRNISRFGLCCRLARYIAPSTRLRAAMILPLRGTGGIYNKLVELNGLVMRVEPEKEEPGTTDYQMAVYFSGVTDEVRSAIDRYVEQHTAEN